MHFSHRPVVWVSGLHALHFDGGQGTSSMRFTVRKKFFSSHRFAAAIPMLATCTLVAVVWGALQEPPLSIRITIPVGLALAAILWTVFTAFDCYRTSSFANCLLECTKGWVELYDGDYYFERSNVANILKVEEELWGPCQLLIEIKLDKQSYFFPLFITSSHFGKAFEKDLADYLGCELLNYTHAEGSPIFKAGLLINPAWQKVPFLQVEKRIRRKVFWKDKPRIFAPKKQ